MLVTIIIPAYNAEKYISETLNCMLNQTYKNLEILCINDGSTDNTETIIKEFAQKDNRIRLHSQKNKGLPATRNVGMKIAKGDLITFIDADDTCSLNTIETSVNLFSQYDCDMVINYLDHRPTVKYNPIGDFAYVSTWQLVIKKDFLIKHSEVRCDEDLTMGEDVVFCHKLLALTNNVVKNNKSELYYRQHQEQMSHIKNDEILIEHINKCYMHVVSFYDEFNLWTTKGKHFFNFLMEYPFTYYLKCNWTMSSKKYIFSLIHKVLKEHNLYVNIKYNNLREILFTIFVYCFNFLLFEPFRFFAFFYYKKLEEKKYKNNINNYKELRGN